jgi:hypothetical protein
MSYQKSKVYRGRTEAMPRVVPSQVVTAIGQLFPQVHSGADFKLWWGNRAEVLALLDLIAQIPSELMPQDPHDFVTLVISLNLLRGALDHWKTQDGPFSHVAGGERTAIYDIRDILERCPDEAPTAATTGLLFITDPDLREGLRIDISTAYQALANGEWKAATVLAGSVVEALLLWTLQQATSSDRQTAITNAMTKGTLSRPPQGGPDHWSLSEYIAVAEKLARIDPNTATQAGLAKDFRNLIHPGRAQRLAQACDRGTALAALAAVEMVVRCLTP